MGILTFPLFKKLEICGQRNLVKVGLLASVREVVMTKRKSDTGKIITVKEFRNYFMAMKMQKNGRLEANPDLESNTTAC